MAALLNAFLSLQLVAGIGNSISYCIYLVRGMYRSELGLAMVSQGERNC